jgi:hypothetical protein
MPTDERVATNGEPPSATRRSPRAYSLDDAGRVLKAAAGLGSAGQLTNARNLLALRRDLDKGAEPSRRERCTLQAIQRLSGLTFPGMRRQFVARQTFKVRADCTDEVPPHLRAIYRARAILAASPAMM